MVRTSLPWAQWMLLVLCLAFAASLSIALGQDIFWDTKNYHLYNAWAFLNDRYTQDIVPASMQSYFNPLPDIPYFWLAQGPLQARPRTLAGLQGLWYGVLIYLVIRIGMRLADLRGQRFGAADIIAALIGATGTMAVSQVGSTTNEIPLAVLVLLSLYQLMPLLVPGGGVSPFRRAIVAGLFCGLAAGLKPTAVVYPPALAVTLLFALGPRTKIACRATTAFVAGAGAAFFVSYGPWAWHLYQTTGNPTFPMFNQLFHSPLTAALNGTDGQFRPRNLMQCLFYPFYWIKKQRGVVTETVFADPRYALAMLALLAWMFASWRKRSLGFPQSDHGTRFVAIFLGVSFVLWMALFSILRYAIPIEALTGLLMLSGVQAWRRTNGKSPFLLTVASFALFVGILTATTYPNWWRSGYAERVFVVSPGAVEPHSLVILAGTPDAYLAPMFPHADTIEFVGLTWFVMAARGYGLWDRIEQRLREHKGPIYVVLRDDPSNAPGITVLEDMLPHHRLESCADIASNLETGRRGKSYALGLRLCRLMRAE